jgi:hypothetical protein
LFEFENIFYLNLNFGFKYKSAEKEFQKYFQSPWPAQVNSAHFPLQSSSLILFSFLFSLSPVDFPAPAQSVHLAHGAVIPYLSRGLRRCLRLCHAAAALTRTSGCRLASRAHSSSPSPNRCQRLSVSPSGNPFLKLPPWRMEPSHRQLKCLPSPPPPL